MRLNQAMIFLLFQSLIWTFCAKVISRIFNRCEPILKGKTFEVQKPKKNDEVKVVNKNVCGPDKTNHKMNIQIAKKDRERKRKRKK